MADRHIHAQASEVLGRRIQLGLFPTPLHRLDRLERALGFSGRIYIKRDDQTGLASGGNKTRKLEYLMHTAIAEGCDSVITAGAQQSNHCRQTAAACARLGLECHLVLGGQEPRVHGGNLLLSSMLGATIHFSGEHRKGEDIPELAKNLHEQGKKPYLVPYGGSNLTGAFGFVHAMLELAAQLQQLSIMPDYIFIASSSGGTQAGMHLGIMLTGLSCRIVPVSIDKDETGGHSIEDIVQALVTEGIQALGLSKSFDPQDAKLLHDYDAAGYGVLTEPERQAIQLLARTEGILVDPVYTGRAFYGMVDQLQKNPLYAGKTILFWHTGGFPAIFQEQYAQALS